MHKWFLYCGGELTSHNKLPDQVIGGVHLKSAPEHEFHNNHKEAAIRWTGTVTNKKKICDSDVRHSDNDEQEEDNKCNTLDCHLTPRT